MNSSPPNYLALFVAIAMTGAGVLGLEAQDSIKEKELKAALAIAQAEARSLKAELVQSEAQRKALVEKLASAVQVSEEQLAEARETELKLQAFGVDLFTQDETSLQQRLLKAVRDLDITEQEVERRSEVIRELSESYLEFLAATPGLDEAKKAKGLAAIEKAAAALKPLSESQGAPPRLTDLESSEVVSLDPEIGLIIIDAGKTSGLRVGTPIAVLQKDQAIYSAMIVDVRESISGAVLQDRLATNLEVAVGDRIQLLPNKPSF